MNMTIKPSDVIDSVTDEIGECLSQIRAKARVSSGKTRQDLLDSYAKLLRKLQRIMRKNLTDLDKDPRITQIVGQLAVQTQLLAKVKREMLTARKVIDKITKVAGIVDDILKIISIA